MSLVAEAVYNVFSPEKLNYELLGNGDSHIHWHIFPRVTGDTSTKGPVWWLDPKVMFDDSTRPNETYLRAMVKSLKCEILNLLNS